MSDREIKFRAWNHIVARMQTFNLQDIEMQEGKIQWQNLTIMQFTGLLDKSGKEIYEGDIVRIFKPTFPDRFIKSELNNWIVMWGKWSYMKGREIGHPDFAFDSFDAQASEIVGNIYQNPELIKA